jgi:hypothetical protein
MLLECSIDHGWRGQPPCELFVPHEGPALSFCRYICRRNCMTPSSDTISSRAGVQTSPSNGRAMLETAKNAMTITRITGAATILLAICLLYSIKKLNHQWFTTTKHLTLSIGDYVSLLCWFDRCASCGQLNRLRWDDVHGLLGYI